MHSPPTASFLGTSSPVIHFLFSACIFSLILPCVLQFFRARAVLVSLPTPAVASAFVASLPAHSPQPHTTSCHGNIQSPGEVTVRHGWVLSSLWCGTDESLLLSHGHFVSVTLETVIYQFLGMLLERAACVSQMRGFTSHPSMDVIPGKWVISHRYSLAMKRKW